MAENDKSTDSASDHTKHVNQEQTQVRAVGGEDESSTEREGDDSHLHEDQKSPTLQM